MTGDPIDRQLEEITGNARVAAAIKEHLQRLSRGAGGRELAEMAQELLDGRTSLRDVAASDVYAKNFVAATDRFLSWYAELSPEERGRLDRETRMEFEEPEC
jgi:hypothetical protein